MSPCNWSSCRAVMEGKMMWGWQTSSSSCRYCQLAGTPVFVR